MPVGEWQKMKEKEKAETEEMVTKYKALLNSLDVSKFGWLTDCIEFIFHFAHMYPNGPRNTCTTFSKKENIICHLTNAKILTNQLALYSTSVSASNPQISMWMNISIQHHIQWLTWSILANQIYLICYYFYHNSCGSVVQCLIHYQDWCRSL